MKYTLKDYQEEAVTEVSEKLYRAMTLFRETNSNPEKYGEPTRTSVSLSSPTGTGKTVMAAGVVERIYEGDVDLPSDPRAVFLWISDSPDLNAQSRYRINSALGPSTTLRTRIIESDFVEEKLRPGFVYFINIQKFGRNSNLAKRHYFEEEQPKGSLLPDDASYDIWHTIQKALNDDDLNLYLILDEAHKGMKSGARTSREKGTIIQRIISGDDKNSPVPAILGISATPQRFDKFLRSHASDFKHEKVVIDVRQAQESGLIKDVISLSIPDEEGNYDHALLSQGARKLLEFSSAWGNYCHEIGTEIVVPLMVVQVPNKVTDEQMREYVDTILNVIPGLRSENFAHVFGEDKSVDVGRFVIDKISAENIQETKEIRVVFAKEAISTGWDCPRAEVMVSFRPAKDETHITQLIGRMVRTPLARRVEGDDVLSSVVCILPKFDKEVATRVAKTIASGGTNWSDDEHGGEALRKVLVEPETVYPRSENMEGVWEKYETLPTETIPLYKSNPIKQLEQIAVEVAADRFQPGANVTTTQDVCRKLRSYILAEDPDVMDMVDDVKEIEILMMSTKITDDGDDSEVKIEEKRVVQKADKYAVELAVRDAFKAFGKNIVHTYIQNAVDKFLAEGGDVDDIEEDAIYDAKVEIAALAKTERVVDEINDFAAKMSKSIYEKYRRGIGSLPEYERYRYKKILTNSDKPHRTALTHPSNLIVSTHSAQIDSTGKVVSSVEVERYDGHLLVSSKDGKFPASLNEWEKHVIDTESKKEGFIGWIRNNGPSALTIAYDNTTKSVKGEPHWAGLKPDFIFFGRNPQGDVYAYIVDPHGIHLGDSLDKLKGYARYVEEYGDEFTSVESVVKINDEFRCIDIKNENTRQRIMDASTAAELFKDEDLYYKYC